MYGWNVEETIKKLLSEHAIKGFLDAEEGNALFRYAKQVSHLGPALEVGSYCGLSTIYLGNACQIHEQTLYAVDHHRGSEEHQPGELYHDVDLYDTNLKRMNTLPQLQKTVSIAEIENTVVPIVAPSALVQRNWGTPLSMVFIDGGHSEAMSMQDTVGWSEHVVAGGVLAIHDIFEHPEQGGQGPYLAMCAVLESGKFEHIEQVQSLAILRRV